MPREVFVYRDGRLVPKHEAEPRDAGGPAAYVISDTMPEMRHPITQQVMDSKSAFRRVTRAHGCVEVGNEVQRDTRRMSEFDKQSRINDIRRAIAELGG
jgi:hypothetical protein